MTCLICKSETKAVQALGDCSEINCSAGCGHFRVSAKLVAKMTVKKESFDVERTRQWLEMTRKTDPVPRISSYDYCVALLHRDC
ncbi:MAG: hypothetical protein ACOH2R_23160 [Pseudomonas sp.]